MQIHVGLKSDPIEYRYSYEWLFRLMADEGVQHVQVGSFFELYQLPDDYFVKLRRQAEDFGITISSVFTAHRELGGFLRGEPEWEKVARRNYERLIEVGALLGAGRVGSNPGAILRDQMGLKPDGIKRYLSHIKGLMGYAYEKGVGCLTIEPMSCLAEPPTLPDEIQEMAEELLAYHNAHPATATVGYCTDIAHGYADAEGQVVCSHLTALEATLPYLAELHIKNTDRIFNSTFGFSEAEREKGIVDLPAVVDLLYANAAIIPGEELVAYAEIGGPKLGRDYSDAKLEDALRASLRYIVECFSHAPAPVHHPGTPISRLASSIEKTIEHDTGRRVEIAPSLMCCDQCHFEESVRRLEAAKMNWLHLDIMDAAFTPNMPLGFEILKQLRPRTALPFDAHLMVEDNDFFVQQMADIGAQQVSVHVESCRHLDRTLSLIRSLGMKAGAALNPATPLSVLKYVLERLDFVLLMTVNPGYAGQALVPSAFRKIAECRAFLDERGYAIPIEIDGNVSFENIPRMVAAGAGILVAGSSSLFHPGGSLRENAAKMRLAIAEGLAMATRIDKEGI